MHRVFILGLIIISIVSCNESYDEMPIDQLPDIVTFSAKYPNSKIKFDKDFNAEVLEAYSEDSTQIQRFVFDKFGQLSYYLFYVPVVEKHYEYLLKYNTRKIIKEEGTPIVIVVPKRQKDNDTLIQYVNLCIPPQCTSEFTLFQITKDNEYTEILHWKMKKYPYKMKYINEANKYDLAFCIISEVKSIDSTSKFDRKDTVNFTLRDIIDENELK